MSTKMSPTHLQRAAYVYVRQSTGHQVRSHPESQRRQYALADHARGLGFAQVVVIDEDVGRSGTGKSVFLKLLIGLIWPDKGQIVVEGQDIHQGGSRHLAQVRTPEGETTAVLFLEDIIEELVGEIQDATRRRRGPRRGPARRRGVAPA